jgi:hypothetical protein
MLALAYLADTRAAALADDEALPGSANEIRRTVHLALRAVARRAARPPLVTMVTPPPAARPS